MSLFFENFGLEELSDDMELIEDLVCDAAENGKVFQGYYDDFYLYRNYGDMEMIISIVKNEGGEWEAAKYDSHCRGNSIWEAVVQGANINPDEQDHMHQRILISGANGKKKPCRHQPDSCGCPAELYGGRCHQHAGRRFPDADQAV